MITPKQITDPHSGHGQRRKRRTRGAGEDRHSREPLRPSKPPSARDPLFDALRAELGL